MTVNMSDFDAYWQQFQELNKNTPNLGGKFENLMFEFIQKCFGDSFGVYRDKTHYNKPAENLFGIKCLNGKTPDIVITSEDTRNLPSIVNIGIEKIKMLIELTSVVKRKIAKKTWKKDVLKYTQIREHLHNNNVLLGTISLFTMKPAMLNTSGNSCLKSNELFLNRMTFAAFLKPQKPKHEPWWFWVSETTLTKSMKIPCVAGCRFNEKCLKKQTEEFKNPIYYLHAITNEILNKNNRFVFQSFQPDQYNILFPKSNNFNNLFCGNSTTSMYCMALICPDSFQGNQYEEN
ncbi:MAG: hypothetical protein HZA48_09285 [Planctomycetes bacterium]|nr:hypothetical protein [Planctomycetota bacterium]